MNEEWMEGREGGRKGKGRKVLTKQIIEVQYRCLMSPGVSDEEKVSGVCVQLYPIHQSEMLVTLWPE